MTPYKQTKTTQNGERGNCLATSFACLLDIPPERIPAFEEMGKDQWKPALFGWLSKMRLKLVTLDTAPEGHAIAVGWHHSGVLHACIVKDGEFHHDPNPSNEFVEWVRNYWVCQPVA